MTITEHANLVEENTRLKIRVGRLVQALGEAAAALDVMTTPLQHFDGCLWKADQRMPCQCGWHDRLHDGMNQARKAEATARSALTAHEASKATMGAGSGATPSTEGDAGLRAACEPAPATTNRDRTKMAAAMVRHVCQGFDSGGESMRSIRAQMAEAAFQILVKDHLDEFAEAFRECEASPYDYLFKARQMLYPYTIEDAATLAQDQDIEGLVDIAQRALSDPALATSTDGYFDLRVRSTRIRLARAALLAVLPKLGGGE